MLLEEYINKFLPYAQQASAPGVPIGLILTHSFLESGRGESQLSKKYNNFFGVKSRPGERFIQLPTKEIINGKEITLLQNFKVYNSPKDSFLDYVRLLQKPRYKSVLETATIPDKFAALGRAGYFTAGNNYIRTATILSKQVTEILNNKFPAASLPIIIIAFLALGIAFLNK